jgi:bacteriorhodopsin
MIRKTILTVAAVAAVTAATLVPASAKGMHRWGWYGGAVFLAAPVIYSCWKYVPTKYGLVKVWNCSY